MEEKSKRRNHVRRVRKPAPSATTIDPAELPTSRSPNSAVHHRERVLVAGKVHTVRVQPWGGVPNLECTLVDETGSILLVFMGRRSIAGLKTGTKLTASGVVGEHHGRPALLNPVYELLTQTPTH
jgi:RecG-like helicase